ncbi:MAG: OmpA family protein [Blastocatellia bacterium]
MGSKMIIGLGLLALMIACAFCVVRHYPFTGAAGDATPTLNDKLTIDAGGAALPPFTAKVLNGKVTLDGTAPDQDAKAKILAAAAAAFGAGNFSDNLTVAPPGAGVSWGTNWLQRILGWLPFLGRFGDKGDISFNGQSATINGEVATADIKSKLLADLRGVFGADFTMHDNLTVTESLLTEAEARAQADLKKVLMKGIEFDSGSDRISAAAAAVLDDAARALTATAEARVEISGHTDNVGEDKMNQALSQRRAESVKKYLTGKGIAADRLSSKGYGPSQPIAENETEEGKARNRRIEFRVIPGRPDRTKN